MPKMRRPRPAQLLEPSPNTRDIHPLRENGFADSRTWRILCERSLHRRIENTPTKPLPPITTTFCNTPILDRGEYYCNGIIIA